MQVFLKLRMSQEVILPFALPDEKGEIRPRVPRFHHHIEPVNQRSDDRVRPSVLIVGRGEETVLLIDDHLVEILPVSSIHPIEDHALFCFRKAVDLIHDFDRDLSKIGPDHILLSLIQLPQIRPANDLFFRLFRMAGYLTSPNHAQGKLVDQRADEFGRGGLSQSGLSNNQLLPFPQPC
jgi:hypothetical protein